MRTLTELREHLQKNHPLKFIFKCTICKVHMPEFDINRHICEPHKTLTIDCDYCSTSFTSVVELLQHLENGHNNKILHKCLNCHRCFPMKILMEFHLLSHPVKGKHLACKICSKKFFTKRDLVAHEKKVHSTEKRKLPLMIP